MVLVSEPVLGRSEYGYIYLFIRHKYLSTQGGEIFVIVEEGEFFLILERRDFPQK